jgi:hypothetical protein
MPQVEFESTIPAYERAKTVHALDRAATVIGLCFTIISTNIMNGASEATRFHTWASVPPPVAHVNGVTLCEMKNDYKLSTGFIV